MSDNIFFETLSLMIEQQEFAEAATQLEQLAVQKLTREQQDTAAQLFAALPDALVGGSVELVYTMVQLSIQRGDGAATRTWYARLCDMRESVKGDAIQRACLENRIFCAGICMQQAPGANLLLSLAVLANEFTDAKFPLARVSVTAKFPSVLRGAKDLSALAKHYRASASIVRPLLWALLEEDGNGVCEVAVAEVLYELGDLSGASMGVAGGLGAENPEILFAALALLARIGAADSAAKPPSEILAYIGDMLEKKQAHWLRPNYDALCARFDILRGDGQAVRTWMDGCGLNDLDGFTLRDCYGLLTKAKAYLLLEEYRNAATLLESLTIALEKENRPLDKIECLAHSAVVCVLLGSEERALQKLEEALLLAQEYSYVRVFADCGRQMHNLLTRYIRQGRHENLGESYIKRILDATRAYGALFPLLYAGKNGDSDGDASGELTQSEIQVLQLLDGGKTNKAIAKTLSVQPTTVSFHLTNIFEKLGASNRVEALNIAREKGILEMAAQAL